MLRALLPSSHCPGEVCAHHAPHPGLDSFKLESSAFQPPSHLAIAAVDAGQGVGPDGKPTPEIKQSFYNDRLPRRSGEIRKVTCQKRQKLANPSADATPKDHPHDLGSIYRGGTGGGFDGAFNPRKDEHDQKRQISRHPVAARRCEVMLCLAGFAGLPPAQTTGHQRHGRNI